MKKIILLFLFILIHVGLFAQNPAGGIIIGASIGSSKVTTEVYPDFTKVNEFDHLPGLIFEPELNKLFGKHFELGTSLSISNLKGENNDDDPQFSAEGYHAAMKNPITEPVEYSTKLIGEKFYVGFYFRSFENINRPFLPEPFIRLGGGYFFYTSEFRYQDPALGVIFGKGVENYTDLSTGVLFATAGIKMYISPVLFINASATINYVRYDFLDAVHNHAENGFRSPTEPDVRGIYSDIKFGIFYQLGSRGVKSGRTGTPGAYLPFSK